VFNGCSFNLYIPALELITKVNLNHINTPAMEKAISEEAKLFTEKRLLNRNV